MEVFDYMASTKDQTASLAFGCTGAGVEERIVIGVEYVIDIEGDFDL